METIHERSERTERVGFRVTPAQKELLAKAAALAGEDVTTFVLARALHDAHSIVQSDRVTVISAEVADAFEEWLAAEPQVIPEMAKRLGHVDPIPFSAR